jgi:hypothetical protein
MGQAFADVGIGAHDEAADGCPLKAGYRKKGARQ